LLSCLLQNADARDSGSRIDVFAASLIALSFGFGERACFETEDAVVREPVQVGF